MQINQVVILLEQAYYLDDSNTDLSGEVYTIALAKDIDIYDSLFLCKYQDRIFTSEIRRSPKENISALFVQHPNKVCIPIDELEELYLIAE